MMNCEICSKPVVAPERCEYCNKVTCNACMKSGKRLAKVKHIIICKGCWGDLSKRRKFKQA